MAKLGDRSSSISSQEDAIFITRVRDATPGCASEAASHRDENANIVSYFEVFGDTCPDGPARYLLELLPCERDPLRPEGDWLPISILTLLFLSAMLGFGPGQGAVGTGVLRVVLLMSGALAAALLVKAHRTEVRARAQLRLDPLPARPGRRVGVRVRVESVHSFVLKELKLRWLLDVGLEKTMALDRIDEPRLRDCPSFGYEGHFVAPSREHFPLEVPETGVASRLELVLRRADAPDLRGEIMVPVMPTRPGNVEEKEMPKVSWEFSFGAPSRRGLRRRILVASLLTWLVTAVSTAVLLARG